MAGHPLPTENPLTQTRSFHSIIFQIETIALVCVCVWLHICLCMCGYAVYHTITILSIITHWFGFWKTNFNELLLWRWWNEAFLLHLLRDGWGVWVGKSNSKFGLAVHMDWEHFCWLEVVSLFLLVVVTFNCNWNWNCYFYCYYLNLFYFYFISFVWLLASEWWLPSECLRCFLLIVVLWLLHLVLLLRCNCRCFLLLVLFLLFSDPWFTCGLFEKCPDEENTK